VDAHTIAEQAEKVQTLSPCQEADGNCFLGQELSDYGGINPAMDQNNVRSLLRNTE
jgi:hypothetical protein